MSKILYQVQYVETPDDLDTERERETCSETKRKDHACSFSSETEKTAPNNRAGSVENEALAEKTVRQIFSSLRKVIEADEYRGKQAS